VLPASLLAWRDDYMRMGRSSCAVGCLAETEGEAQLNILVELATPHYQEYLAAWLDAGRPVMVLDDKRPDTTPARERLLLDTSEDNSKSYL